MMKFGRKKALDSQDSRRMLKDESGDDDESNNGAAPPEQAPSSSNSLLDNVKAPSEPAAPVVEYKFGIASRLDESVPKKSVSLSKRSPDLVPLAKEFEEMRKSLRSMIGSAKKFQESMIAMDKNRLQMVKEMTAFAEASPIANRVSSTDQAQSVVSIYQNASKEVDTASQKFQTDVLDYCIEWELVVSTRVDKEMAATKKLRDNYNHYLGKVDAMRKKFNAQEAKGKGLSESNAEKMQRNEQKLLEASTEFEAMAGPLCVLLEEVVQQGWQDLYPLIQATIQWEVNRSQNEARSFLLMQPGALEAVFNHATGTEKPHQPAEPTPSPTSSPASSTHSKSGSKKAQPSSSPGKKQASGAGGRKQQKDCV